MFGDATFLSCSVDAPGWNCRLRAPHWTAAAQCVREVPALLAQACRRADAGEWVVLALAYEAASAFDPDLATKAPWPEEPLALAAAYAGPVSERAPVWAEAACPRATTDWRPLISRARYRRDLATIREAIRQGECYQINYTFPLVSRFTGDPAGWFAALARRQAAGFCCHLDFGRWHLLSLSPELFFARQGDRVVTQPMKGTLPRGRTPEEDAEQARALAASAKNQAENRMITDLMRNDLGRIALPGSVSVPELFTVRRLGTAWQMTSTVAARVDPATGLERLLAALFPCGSITGAPKRSAMEHIRRLEAFPRGFYTGTIGLIRPGGECRFAVAIRTVELDTRTGACRFGVGGGITYDSEPGDEYEECRVKAAFLSLPDEDFQLLETLRLDRGRFPFLAEHRRRLERSAAFFGFSYDASAMAAALESVRVAFPQARRRVRLLLARDGAVQVESFALGRTATVPARLGWAARPVVAAETGLFHKTTRRARYDAALAARPDCDDVLLYNTDGQVTESCRANLVAALDGRLVTPALPCGLLPGTYRERLLRRGVLAEACLTPADLAAASRLWLINSVRLWRPAVLDTPGPPA